MDQTCLHCGAKFWLSEKDRNSSKSSPKLAMCCAGGKIRLPPVLDPPPYLLDLYTSSRSEARNFRNNIRAYNGLLACSSFGAKIDESFQGQGVANFKIHGQIYHRMGSLLSVEGQNPVFAQLYIYDTDHENSNRLNVMRNINPEILQNLQNMLDTYNPYIQNFRQVRDFLRDDAESTEISMRVYCDRSHDARRFSIITKKISYLAKILDIWVISIQHILQILQNFGIYITHNIKPIAIFMIGIIDIELSKYGILT